MNRAFNRLYILVASIFILYSPIFSKFCFAENLTLEILEHQPLYEKGEDVNITVVLRNTGSDPILVPVLFVPPYYYINFRIVDSNNQVVPFTGVLYDLVESEDDLFLLPIGGLVGKTLNLKEYYAINDGKYTLQARFIVRRDFQKEFVMYPVYDREIKSWRDIKKVRKAWKGELDSNTVEFIVK